MTMPVLDSWLSVNMQGMDIRDPAETMHAFRYEMFQYAKVVRVLKPTNYIVPVFDCYFDHDAH